MLGVCAAVIDIGTSWMFDLKEGICMNAFWLNREQCCWVANDTTFDQEGCAQVGVSVCCLPMFQKHMDYSASGRSHMRVLPPGMLCPTTSAPWLILSSSENC